jgi:predicted RNase H-like nuclease (RuvC/YqgF family)
VVEQDKKQTKTQYKKTFTPEVWDQLNVVIDGLGYGKTIQNILEEKYEITIEDPKKTLEVNSIRILEQRKKELLEKQKLEKLRKEVIDLEHKQNKTISKEQKEIDRQYSKIKEMELKIENLNEDIYNKEKEIKRLRNLGNELKKTVRSYCLDIPYRKDFIDRCKF